MTKQFEALCSKRGILVDIKGYSEKSRTYAADCRTVNVIETLSELVSVRSIAPMPLVRINRSPSLQSQAIPHLPTRDEVEGDVPVVAVVDTGVSEQYPELNSWITGRYSDVAPPYRNTDHGTFVAGLICWGRRLNPDLPNIEEDPCALFDVQVIPNDDAKLGPIDRLSENELLSSLRTVLQQQANQCKVWNLSLGTDDLCSLHEFSNLAQELDNLQEEFQVSFVISAGNYKNLPLLDYPRTNEQIDRGRITVPADSVLGITVGSVSQVNFQNNGPENPPPICFLSAWGWSEPHYQT